MNKLLVILFCMIVATGCSAGRYATGPTDAAGNRIYSEKEQQTAAEVDALIQATNFQFVAYNLQTRTGGIETLRGYQSAKVLPERLLVELTGTRVEGFFLGDTAYDTVVQRGDKWYITIVMDYQTGKMTFEFEIERSTANATLKVSTNRAFEVKTYRGYILPN